MMIKGELIEHLKILKLQKNTRTNKEDKYAQRSSVYVLKTLEKK